MHRGMSFVEMIIAIAILIMGMGVFTMLFIRSWETNRFVLESGQAQMQASQGVQKMVDIIRNARQADNGAFPLVSAGDEELILYSNVDDDSAIERVRFRLVSGSIVQEVRNPNSDIPPQYANNYESQQEIVRNIVQEDVHPIFSYYDNTNTELSGAFSLNEVTMVKVILAVDDNENRPPSATIIESFAAIRNLNEYDRSN